MDNSSFSPDRHLADAFGGKLRIRVCGICIQEGAVLLAKHTGMGPKELWLPPGGGLSFGEPLEVALQREWQEETGLHVQKSAFSFVYEIIRPPFHAIEVYFHVTKWDGVLSTGSDPELSAQEQIIEEVAFVPFETIKSWPSAHTHHLFSRVHSIEELKRLTGHYAFTTA